MSPELVTVLVAGQRRARGNQPQIPPSGTHRPPPHPTRLRREASTVGRLAEAQERQCLGEVSALEDSLRHIRSRKAQAVAGSDQR